MLASLSSVWDTSNCCPAFKVHPILPVTQSSCRLAAFLRLKRRRFSCNGVVHEAHFCRNYCCDPRSTSELGKVNEQGRSPAVTSKSRVGKGPFLRFPDLGFRAAPILTPESRPVIRISRNAGGGILAISLTAVATRKDTEVLALTKGDIRVVYTAQEVDRNINEDEQLRRRRIGIANKGRVPWNKGVKHRPETIKLIREKTMQAMQNPQVLAKLRGNSRHPQTDETRIKIGQKMRVNWDRRKRIRGYQEVMLRDWRTCVAEAARKGDLWEEEMAWNSYSLITKQMRMEAAAVAREEKIKRMEKEKVAKRSSKSEEHRLKISNAIKSKWEDPEYQLKVRQGMAKSILSPRPRPRPSRNPTRRKPSSSRAISSRAVVKGPLDQAFLTAVMSGEKKAHSRQRRSKGQAGRVAAHPRGDSLDTRIRKVDLLKRFSSRAQTAANGLMETERMASDMASSSQDPLDLGRSKHTVWTSRSALDLKRREASQRAKTLMAEAEEAVKVLEGATDCNDAPLGCLADIRKVIDEAAQFIQAADSLNVSVDNNDDDDLGEPRRGVSVDYCQPDPRLHEDSHIGRKIIDRSDDSAELNPNFDGAYRQGSRYAHSGQDSALGMKERDVAILDEAEGPHFCDEAMEQGGWDTQNILSGGSRNKSRVSSSNSLLDARGRSVRAVADAAGKAVFERWQRANIIPVEGERDFVRVY